MGQKPLYQGPIYVQKSAIQGYGVFAAKAIAEDEIIEECYTLRLEELPDDLLNYCFGYKDRVGFGLALGFGSIYNHSETPNITHHYHPEAEVLVFKALKRIKAGEELCTYYSKTWFEERGLAVQRPRPGQALLDLGRGILLRASLACALLGGLLYLANYSGAA